MKFDQRIIAKVTPWRRTWPRFWVFFARDAIWLLLGSIGLAYVMLPPMQWLFTLVLPAIAAHVIATLVQRVIRRERPTAPTSYHLLVRTYSFPSGHAMTAFALATLLVAQVPMVTSSAAAVMLISTVFWLFALCIALSRVVVGVHYPSDILAGGLMGMLFGWLVVLI